MGDTLTTQGARPDDSKIKAILEYTKPESRQDVLRLVGMVNFITKFAPNVSAPLRQLTKKGIEFCWLENHDKAFADLKHKFTHPETLRYYDVKKPVTLQVD